MSQGAAVTVSVLHQRVCKRVVGSAWAWALIFTYGTNISKAINGAFQLSNFSKNVIIHPEVFLQYDSTSLPRNWVCKQHWDEPVNGAPLLPAQIPPSLVLSWEKGDT